MLDAPFVLLDDARDGGAPARLYRAPQRIVTASTLEEVRPALAMLRAACAEGREVAGYLSYEAGAALMPRAVPVDTPALPLLWFGVFDGHEEVDAAALLPDPAGAWAGIPVPAITRAAYDAAFARVRALIDGGDIYQANLTFRADVPVAGDPLALYAGLRRAAGAGYGAVIDTGAVHILSLSPELFVALDGDALTCRPMKGTAMRGDTPEDDRTRADTLGTDAKQRAENLMIVDLMRNDLARVAVAGSVAVPELFTVETYPTIHQMTSAITATLAPARDGIDVVEAMFPCGSITGAPKQRAMEVIAAVETGPRGVYTGAIGRIGAGGMMLNVAIRTLTIPYGEDRARIGLGSGVVADSRADEERAECLAKAAFVTAGQRRFDLIETMAFDPDAGLLRLERHLSRMSASAEALGFAFDRHGARNELQVATFRLRKPSRVRLLLARSGAIAIAIESLPAMPADPVPVAVVPLPVDQGDFRLRHKTSDRGFYDTARRDSGAFEVVFANPGGALTEGSFTSIFVDRGDGLLVTPPLATGLLPGILRGALIDEGRAIEGRVTAADLVGGFFVGNAVRGLMPAIVAVAKAVPAPL